MTNAQQPKRTARLRTLAGGIVAAGALAITLAAAPTSDTPEPTSTAIDQSGVAVWANANDMVGGSPVSLHATPEAQVYTAIDQSGVVAWANANGMVGGSPVSLHATPEAQVYTAVDQSAVAAWAEANQLQGASPTSLGSPTGHDVGAE